MFGMKMTINHIDLAVHLIPLSSEDLPILAQNFNSLDVLMFTQQLFAQTLENEQDWYDKKRKSEDEVLWGIRPGESERLIGVTALHQLDLSGSCTSGIIIWDKNWWNKGVASRTHLARTLFAADFLNRNTIKSLVRTKNPGSFKALERVGYIRTGIELRTTYRQGKFLDTYHYTWLNPDRLHLLYPEGLPEEYESSVEKARVALDLARQVVSFP